MLFKPIIIASWAAIMSTVTAAPFGDDCPPEENVACYWERSSGKRSPADVTVTRLPTLTEPTIPPLGAPTGVNDGGYERRSVLDEDGDIIVIGSKRSPEPKDKLPTLSTDVASYVDVDAASYDVDRASYRVDEDYGPISEDVGAYDEEKRSLSRRAKGLRVLAREPEAASIDLPVIELNPKQPIDGDYPIPDDSSYPVRL